MKQNKSFLSGKQRGLTGFLSPDNSSSDDEYADALPISAALPSSAAQPSSASQLPISAAQSSSAAQPSSAAPGFSSPVSAASFNSPPAFNLGSPVLQRMSPNPNVCAHGVYRNGSCQVCKDRQQTLTTSTNLPTGVIPDSARMFEPHIPGSAGLSFSELEVSEINPVNKNLFGTKAFYSSDEGEMGGGRRKYRKSSKKSKRKSSKKSQKKSSRKARKLTRR